MTTIITKYKNLLLFILAVFFFLFSCYVSKAQNGVGVNTVTPKSNFEVNGSFGQTVTTVTVSTTLDATQSIVVCNNGAVAITITLPAVAACSGRIYNIKRDATSTADVTIAGTIDNATNLIIFNASQAVTLFSNGTEWKTMNNYTSSSSTGWLTAGNSGTTAGTNYLGTTDATDLVLKTNGTERFRALSAGNIGFGVTAPTAYLHLKAGTAAAGTAPLKLTAGPLLTTAEPGAIEYKGHTFYMTTYLVRRSVMLAQDVVMSNVAVSGTTSETTIYTATMAADYLTAGKMINIKLFCNYRTSGSSPTFTVKVKEGANVILTTTSVGAATGTTLRPLDIDIMFTIRSIGAAGSVISYGKVQQDNMACNADYNTAATFNTTVTNTVTVTITWTSGDTDNQFNLLEGVTECMDANN